MRELRFKTNAIEDMEFWLKNDRKLLQKAIRILKECQKMPFEGIGKPEPLKENFKGLWSRRLDDEHRIVYGVTDDEIIVYQMKGHYDDK